MNSEFKDTLYLFSCGALNIIPHLENKINIKKISEISHKQGIWEVVYIALKKCNDLDIPKALSEQWEQHFLGVAVKHLRRQNVINTVLNELKANNIDAYMLKGDIVAQYYAEPLSRISSDTDIYVGQEQLNRAENIFKKCGFTVYARSPIEHHTVCKHPVGGSVDLHLTFHDDCYENTYFKGYTHISEKGTIYNIENQDVLSLGANDNATFLFLHIVKHFLSCGTGIRQIMDFLLFWKNNIDKINIEQFKTMISDLKLYNLFELCVSIGINELQFEQSLFSDFDIKYNHFFTEWLLTDIEQGGIFGKLEYRKMTHYAMFGGDMQITKDKKTFLKYLKLYAKTFSYEYLSKKYNYLENNRLLFPIAFVNRIYEIVASAVRVRNTMKKSVMNNDEYVNIKNRMSIIEQINKH